VHALTQLHEDPALVAWWAAVLERAAGWLTPRRRRLLLSACSLVALAVALPRRKVLDVRDPGIGLLVLPLVLVLVWGCHRAAVRWERVPRTLRRRPQLALHAIFWLVVAGLWIAPTRGAGGAAAGDVSAAQRVLMLLVVVLPFLLWRLGYLLKTGQRGKAAGTTLGDHLFYVWPLWGGSETPYGKGLDHLSRHEARTAEALARSQLAGLKLLLLVLVWRATAIVMDAVVYGDGPLAVRVGGGLGIPRLDRAIAAPAVPVVTAWLSVYAELFAETLAIAIKGHAFIGVLRLLGFNVFRNTYRPLLAESVVEFWSRYYYYFKELLVEFFFYPTYARWRVRPWLRTFLAVFAAAAVGNLYYHVLQSDHLLIAAEPGALWRAFCARAVYSVALAVGVWISMLREQRRRGATVGSPTAVRRSARIFAVWTFFALLHVWGVGRATPAFADRARFFGTLLGL
jgi:hypothetical protein